MSMCRFPPRGAALVIVLVLLAVLSSLLAALAIVNGIHQQLSDSSQMDLQMRCVVNACCEYCLAQESLDDLLDGKRITFKTAGNRTPVLIWNCDIVLHTDSSEPQLVITVLQNERLIDRQFVFEPRPEPTSQ